MKKLTLVGVALGTAFLAVAPISLHWTPAKGPLLSLNTAEARIGRPLTPGSIAGVHRRVHRRAYRRGYYYGGVARCGYYPYPPCY